MYFQKLETLRQFDIDLSLLGRLDELLARVDAQGLQRFSGTLMAQELNTDLTTTLDLLLKCVNLGILKVNYEVERSECGSGDFVVAELKCLTAEERAYRVCDAEYIPSSDLIWITFDLGEYPFPK